MKKFKNELSEEEILLLRKSLDDDLNFEQIKEVLSRNIQIKHSNEDSDKLNTENLEKILLNKDYKKFLLYLEKLTYFSYLVDENVSVNNFVTGQVNNHESYDKKVHFKEEPTSNIYYQEIKVNNDKLIKNNQEKIVEIISTFKNDILKRLEYSKLTKLEIELLYKITEPAEFIDLISKSVITHIKNENNLLTLIDNIDSLNSTNALNYNVDFIYENFFKISDHILESFTDKFNFGSMKSSIIQHVFINSILEIYVKLIAFKHRYYDLSSTLEKNQLKNKMFIFKTSEEGINLLANFCKILEIFLIYFGKIIDYRDFFKTITNKCSVFLTLFLEEFNLILMKENLLISETFLEETFDKSIEMYPINVDHLFQKEFKEIVKSRKISLGMSNTLNDSKYIDLGQIEILFKKKFKVGLKKRKKQKQEILYLSLFSNYYSFLHGKINEINKLKFFYESLIILLLEKVVISLENVFNDLTKLLYLNESIEEALIFYSSFKYFQNKLEKTVLKINFNRVFHLPPLSTNIIHFHSIEEIISRIKEIAIKFRQEFEIFFFSSFERYINTFIIRSLLQFDWKSPKNEPSSLQQFLISKDSKNKETIMKNYCLDLVPSYGLINFSLFFFELIFEKLEKLYESLDLLEIILELFNNAVGKITSFYLNISPFKNKIKYVINDLMFILDKSIIIYSEILWRLISFFHKADQTIVNDFRQSLFIYLYKIHFSISYIEIFLYELIRNENNLIFETVTKKIQLLIQKMNHLNNSFINFSFPTEQVENLDKSFNFQDEIRKKVIFSQENNQINSQDVKHDVYGIFYGNYFKIIDEFLKSKDNFLEYEKNYLIFFQVMVLIFTLNHKSKTEHSNYNELLANVFSSEKENIYTPKYLFKARNKIKKFSITSIYKCQIDKEEFLNEDYEKYIKSKLIMYDF